MTLKPTLTSAHNDQ